MVKEMFTRIANHALSLYALHIKDPKSNADTVLVTNHAAARDNYFLCIESNDNQMAAYYLTEIFLWTIASQAASALTEYYGTKAFVKDIVPVMKAAYEAVEEEGHQLTDIENVVVSFTSMEDSSKLYRGFMAIFHEADITIDQVMKLTCVISAINFSYEFASPEVISQKEMIALGLEWIPQVKQVTMEELDTHIDWYLAKCYVEKAAFNIVGD